MPVDDTTSTASLHALLYTDGHTSNAACSRVDNADTHADAGAGTVVVVDGVVVVLVVEVEVVDVLVVVVAIVVVVGASVVLESGVATTGSAVVGMVDGSFDAPVVVVEASGGPVSEADRSFDEPHATRTRTAATAIDALV